jgi:phage baseplate assembly protein W
MAHVDIPHFAYPFRLERHGPGSQPVVVEQDSLDDVLNCVEIAMLTQIGERVDMPSFGIDDPTFQQQPIDVNLIGNQVAAHEPRAEMAATQHPDALDVRIARVVAEVSTGEVAE